MARRLSAVLNVPLLLALVALAACHKSGQAELDSLDNQIAANQTDPALRSALQDQIMVDPNLAQQSNRNAARPPETPTQAQYPAGAASEDSFGCGGAFDYNTAWANRLPAPFAVYPGGQVNDAAGKDRGACRTRVVTYTSAAAPGRVLDWYRTIAAKGGYSADNQTRGTDAILAGTDSGDGAYYLIVGPLAGGGSDVALIVNTGR